MTAKNCEFSALSAFEWHVFSVVLCLSSSSNTTCREELSALVECSSRGDSFEGKGRRKPTCRQAVADDLRK